MVLRQSFSKCKRCFYNSWKEINPISTCPDVAICSKELFHLPLYPSATHTLSASPLPHLLLTFPFILFLFFLAQSPTTATMKFLYRARAVTNAALSKFGSPGISIRSTFPIWTSSRVNMGVSSWKGPIRYKAEAQRGVIRASPSWMRAVSTQVMSSCLWTMGDGVSMWVQRGSQRLPPSLNNPPPRSRTP